VIDRRSSNRDPLTFALRTAATLGWIAIFIAQIIAWKAAPELDSGIARYHELEIRTHWQQNWVEWMPFVLGACTVLSLFALGVSPIRSRRKSDPKRVHLLILLGLTATGYFIYWSQILINVQ